MLVQESFVNATKGYRFGDSEPYEIFTENIGVLFASLQREYGRCVSRIYVDLESEPQPIAVGWVFQKRMRYEDTADYYLREVWITMLEKVDTVTRERHYHKLD